MHTIAINPELSVMCNSNTQPQAAQFDHPVSGAEAGLWAAFWSLTTLITGLRCDPDTAARRRCGPTFARPVQQTNIFAENLFFHINNTMTLLQILVKRCINACRIQEWTANGRALAFLNIQSKRVDGY